MGALSLQVVNDPWEQSSPGVGSFSEIRRFGEIDSTNTYLLGESRAGAPHGLVAVADIQTAGRGRRDREWVAPPRSSLLCSVLLRPENEIAPFTYGAAIAMAARTAVKRLTDIDVDIKWPNDLLVAGKKLGGILVETEFSGPWLKAVIVGLGLNLNWPEVLPSEISDLAISLNHLGVQVGRDELLHSILKEFDLLVTDGEAKNVISDYSKLCVTVGQKVKVITDDGEYEGVAQSINDDGALMVIDNNRTTREVNVADVVHLRNF